LDAFRVVPGEENGTFVVLCRACDLRPSPYRAYDIEEHSNTKTHKKALATAGMSPVVVVAVFVC